MIYGKSTDAVLIKKISLHIWTLRDEIECTINQQVHNGSSPDLNRISKEYIQTVIPKAEGTPDSVSGPQLVVDNNVNPPAAAPIAAAETTPAAPAGTSPTAEAQTATPATPPVAGPTTAAAAAPATDAVATIAIQVPTDPSESGNPLEITHIENTENGLQKIVQRIPLLPTNKIFHGSIILQEINMDRMCLFTNHLFLEGQSIVLEFLIPKRFIVSADVITCKRFNMCSHILGRLKLPYRMTVQFTYARPGERTLMREFLKSISSLNFKEHKSNKKNVST
jgi:hypothetical protein